MQINFHSLLWSYLPRVPIFLTMTVYTLTKIINAILLFLPPISWAELKDLRLFLCTQKAYFSQILFTNLSKSVSEHFSFAEIIHPPHRCGISRCWLDSMIIAQVCLRLATIKGHSKMCSFTVLGGPGGGGGSENQLVSGVTTICLMQCNTSPSHRVDQVVDCGLWNVGPLLFNGCAKLLDIGRNWNTLSYTPIQSIPNMLNGWHVRWVCWPCKNWDVFSFQELCTDPCNMGPCIIMLQHEVMVVDEWHNNGPQDLVTVRPVGCTAKFSETPLETAYGREMNIQFTGNSSGGHSCSQHANCTLPQNLQHLWHCAVW